MQDNTPKGIILQHGTGKARGRLLTKDAAGNLRPAHSAHLKIAAPVAPTNSVIVMAEIFENALDGMADALTTRGFTWPRELRRSYEGAIAVCKQLRKVDEMEKAKLIQQDAANPAHQA